MTIQCKKHKKGGGCLYNDFGLIRNLMNSWNVYILRCADDTLYTGITTDMDRRLQEHNAEKSKTKYTRVRQPVKLVFQEGKHNRVTASQREAEIKKLKRNQKEELIKSFVKTV